MRIEFQREKDLSTKMVSLKRNWISKKLKAAPHAIGSRHPVLLYIHSISVTTTCSRSEHIFFPFYSIPNRFHTFTEQHTEEKKYLLTSILLLLSKSVVFKMEFHVSDCGIPFHHRVASARTKQGEEKEKVRLKCDDGGKNCGFELWGIFLPLLTAFLSKKFFIKKTCRDFCFIFKHFYLSQEKMFRIKNLLRDLN